MNVVPITEHPEALLEGLTTNVIPRVTAAGSLADSSFVDDGTRPQAGRAGAGAGLSVLSALIVNPHSGQALNEGHLGINRGSSTSPVILMSVNGTYRASLRCKTTTDGWRFANGIGTVDFLDFDSTSINCNVKTVITGTAPTVAPAAGTVEIGGGDAWLSGRMTSVSAAITGLTLNNIPRVTAAGLIADSALSDDGTTVSSSRRLSVLGVGTSAAPILRFGATAQSGFFAPDNFRIGVSLNGILHTYFWDNPSDSRKFTRVELLEAGWSHSHHLSRTDCENRVVGGDSLQGGGSVRVYGQNHDTRPSYTSIFRGTTESAFWNDNGTFRQLGTAPAVAPAANTVDIGGGAYWGAGQIRTSSTAADSILTAGGTRSNAFSAQRIPAIAGTVTWQKVAHVDGVAASQGTGGAIIVAAGTQITVQRRDLMIIDYGQRGDNNFSLSASRLSEASTTSIRVYWKQISTYVFEVWLRRITFSSEMSVHQIGPQSVGASEIGILESTTTEPSGLTEVTVERQLRTVNRLFGFTGTTDPAAAGATEISGGNGKLSVGTEYRVGETKVVGAQGDAVADAAAGAGTATSGGFGFVDADEFNTFINAFNAMKDQLNAALSRLRDHGLIATT